MIRFSGSCRFLFNKALSIQKERYAAGEKKLSYEALSKALTDWKSEPEMVWLREAPAQSLQQTLMDLDRAYTNFFAKRASLPRFKKKGRSRGSFRYPQSCKIDQENGRLFLPKLGWIRYRKSRDVLGTLKNVTVSQSNGKWFASLQTEREVEIPARQGTSVGIDMGITRFATLSDGTVFEPLNIFKRHEKALAKAQRRLSRKTKFGKNWKKEKEKVQRVHAKIANTRRDYLHKTSTAISKNHAIVSVEDLRVRNMSASASGTVETPGINVRAKSGLNKAILDQGWGEFLRQLEYKMLWSGGHFIAVPAKNTSRTCPSCGHIAKENRKTQSQFLCVECGFEENADLVGAINVLRAGHAQIACEVSLNRGQQQEPTEATVLGLV